MQCVQCGSQNLRLFKLICDEGTTTQQIKAKSKSGIFDKGGTRTVTGTTTSQTALALRCSPPSDPSGVVTMLAAFPGFIVGIYSAFKVGFIANSFWIGLLVLGATFVGLLC